MGRRKKPNSFKEEEIEKLNEELNQSNLEEEKLFQLIKVNIKCKTENQKKVLNSIKTNEITIVSGLAGSGKTYIACAEALKLLKNYEKYKRIILIKSITPLKNEDPGSLPGDLNDKLGPIMESFYDNFRKLIGKSRLQKMIDLGLIEFLPIAFARGRSIDNAVIIIDEAQNITLGNIRTLMTRIGYNSKMIILGDIKQKDIRNQKDSSLEIIADRFKDKSKFGVVELYHEDDVVRNPIIKLIENTFDDIEGN